MENISKEEIHSLIKKTIEEEISKDWYSNKELFKMFNCFKEEMSQQFQKNSEETKGLWNEIKGFREDIKKYNGLREAIDKIKKEFEVFKKEFEVKEGEKRGKIDLVRWIGYFIGIVSTIIAIYSSLGG